MSIHFPWLNSITVISTQQIALNYKNDESFTGAVTVFLLIGQCTEFFAGIFIEKNFKLKTNDFESIIKTIRLYPFIVPEVFSHVNFDFNKFVSQ
jgi:hypothetical protein